MNNIQKIIWLYIPFVNFIIWWFIGTNRHVSLCIKSLHQNNDINNNSNSESNSVSNGVSIKCDNDTSSNSILTNIRNRMKSNSNDKKCTLGYSDEYEVDYDVVDTKEFDKQRRHMAPFEALGDTVIFKTSRIDNTIKYDNSKFVSGCDSIWTHFGPTTSNFCFAVVRIDPNVTFKNAFPILRFDQDVEDTGREKSEIATMSAENKIIYTPIRNEHNKGHFYPCGYFRKVPREAGRIRINEKLKPFFEHFEGPNGMIAELKNKLSSKGIVAGSDIALMVVNEGEIDLFMNFACSCQQHNIKLSNVLVIAASKEIVNLIEATGAIGIYHDEGYGDVSKKASGDYLDRVFVDMMWYKAFALFITLHIEVNVLFQDADIVWFREPFQYLKDLRSNLAINDSSVDIKAFFSDDGQRSLRYAPFYANSGFYYLLASKQSEYFAWSIMTAYDSVQRLGSHQNVITTRLNEGLGLSHKHIKILSTDIFPNGYQYHHERSYMKRLREKQVNPYNFHMCWTQGKKDKLLYLNKSKMWYLTTECSAPDTLTSSGTLFKSLDSNGINGWSNLFSLCCTSMPGAP